MLRKVKKKFVILIVAIFLYIGSASAGTINGTVSTKKVKSPKDTLVYIKKIDGKEFTPPKEMPVMNQVNLVFIPRVIPVVEGTTVGFKNDDNVLHNVFGVGDDEFDLGTWKGDEIRTHTFNKLGDVAILCNVHPEMEAYVVVLQNPYFALTDENGNYRIEDIPQGAYTLKTWNDRLRPVSKKIEVLAKEEATVDFNLKR